MTDTTSPPINNPLRSAFLTFIHTARFYFLQDAEFNRFLDEEAPALALDLFRAMRATGDFVAPLPDDCCSFCKMRPGRAAGGGGGGGGERAYYTHLAPDVAKLTACCAACAGKKGLGPGTGNWAGKRVLGGGA